MTQDCAIDETYTCTPQGLPTIEIMSASPAPRVTEDSPEWDCHTMGNQTCGLPRTGTTTDLLQLGAGLALAGVVLLAAAAVGRTFQRKAERLHDHQRDLEDGA